MKSNVIKDTYRTLMDYIFLNLLIVFFTAITAGIGFGVAFTASYNISFKLLDQDRATYIVKDWFHSIKENWLPASMVWIVISGLGCGLFFIHNYAFNQNLVILQIGVYLAGLELILLLSYFFPFLSTFQATTWQHIRNALLLSHSQLKLSFLQLGNLAVVIVLIFYVHYMFILIAIGIYLFLSAFTLRKLVTHFKQQLERDAK